MVGSASEAVEVTSPTRGVRAEPKVKAKAGRTSGAASTGAALVAGLLKDSSLR